MSDADVHVAFERVTVRYGGATALVDVDLEVPRHRITALIGPARSGKSTLLKCINRMVDVVPDCRVRGRVLVDGVDVLTVADVHDLRRRIGMVLPLPVGLPLSVYDNVALAPRFAGVRRKADLNVLVEQCLRQAALWDELKDRLHDDATLLSGGQQQRLAIARALSHRPDILCLDEFSIAIDPIATMKIEDLLMELASHTTILVATNLVQQARRLADRVAFLNAGRIVDVGPADVVFSERPANPLTFAYVRGHFG
jgi:phosphate transport system ATP-binding protein